MIQYWILLFSIGGILCYPTDEHKVSNSDFNTYLSKHMIENLPATENLVFSPASIHTLLGLTYIGTEGQTAKEIENVLHLPSSSNKDEVANNFQNLLKVTQGSDSLIKIANKIYVKEGLSIAPHFNKIAEDSFASESENINFEDSDAAVKTINKWIEQKTNNKIKDLLDNISKSSKIALINAIHFKGEWKIKPLVRKSLFFNTNGNKVETDFLKVKDNFKFGKFPKLDAVAAELPYKNSNLSLMIILPNFDSNLNSLETKLKTVNLIDVSKGMTDGETAINIPKFKIKTKLKVTDILDAMGIHTLFSEKAEFNMVMSTEKVKVTDVIIEAFIDVNEIGTEAAAASALVALPYSAISGIEHRSLFADRPFMFAIKDNENVYFTGYLRKLFK